MIYKRSLSCAVLLVALLQWGCVSSNSMRVGNTYPPRPHDYIIDVYVSLDAPVNVQQSISNPKSINDLPSSAEVVGRIDTNGAPLAGWDSVIADAKSKAREMGGDGLVIKGWGSPLAGVDSYGQAYNGKAISMEVVRYNP